ncbi:MAG: phosphodiester glycosidase family protein, partial [Pirellulales bacterium]
MRSLQFTLAQALCALFIASVAGAATNEVTEPFQGVRLIHSRSTVPRLVDMYVVEIDMAAPGLAFRATPSNGALVGDATPQTTRAFVSQIGAQIGINANFFSSAGSGQYNVLGLSVSNGDAYSPFQSGFLDALNVSLSNVATIIRATGTTGFAHTPPTSLYNAVGGNTRLVTGGVNVANSDTAIHPRTAAGVTTDGKLLLFTVDGRNAGHSEGLTYREMADVLIRWGARDAINLDGGGSTTLVMDNPITSANDVQVLNIPVGVSNVPHSERSNGNNFGVFASRPTGPTQNSFVFADFEQGDMGPFSSAINFSGSNRGFIGSQSSAETISGQAFDGQWSQRLTIIDDPNSDGDTQNPGGAWFARHVSGGGNPANNVSRSAIGSVGFW